MATGAYLFGKDKNGKRKPVEVEYLTDEERHDVFIHRNPEELINWINMLCDKIAETYPQETHEEGHSIASGMNDPSPIQEAAYKNTNPIEIPVEKGRIKLKDGVDTSNMVLKRYK